MFLLLMSEISFPQTGIDDFCLFPFLLMKRAPVLSETVDATY